MRAFLLFLLLMVVASVSEAATITFAFTNRITGQPLTNSVKFIPVTGPTMANGAVLTRGPAINITPNPTNGVGVVNLLQGHYLATNAYLGKGILFSVPLSSDTYTLQQLAISGYNTYVYNVGSNTFNTGFPLHIDGDLAGWNLTNGGFVGAFYGDGGGLTNLQLGDITNVNLINATNNDLLFGLNATNNDFLIGLNGTNYVLQIGQNATNNDLLFGLNSTNNTLAVGASLTNYVLLVGQNGTNYAQSLFQSVSNASLTGVSNYILLVSQNATNEALLIGANGTNNTVALGSALTNGAILNLSNYVLLVSQNATNEALLIGLNGTNNLNGLGLAITNGPILNLSNYVLAISQNATNQALLIGQQGTNESLLIGLNATNNDALVGLSITNGGLASLSNYVSTVSDNATNEALLIGQNATNYAFSLFNTVSNTDLTDLSNYVSTVSQNATNEALLIGANGTNNVLAAGALLTNYVLQVGQNATNNDLLFGLNGTNNTLALGSSLTNYVAAVSVNATNEALLVGLNGTNNTAALGSSITNGGLSALSNYVAGVSGNATNEALLIGANGSNNVAALGFSITNGGIAVLSNYTLTVSQNATNEALLVGANATNNTAALGESITNGGLFALSNYVAAVGANATNEALLIGADTTNNSIALGLSITNGGLSALSNYVAGVSSDATNNDLAIGLNVTNYVLQVGQNGTNYADYLFGTVPAGVWAITNGFIYPTANADPYTSVGPIVISTNGTLYLGQNSFGLQPILDTTNFRYGFVISETNDYSDIVPLEAFASGQTPAPNSTGFGHIKMHVNANASTILLESNPSLQENTNYLKFLLLGTDSSYATPSGLSMIYAAKSFDSNSPLFFIDANGNEYLSGTLSAATFYGDGSGLTNLNLGSLTNVNLVNATNNDLLFGLYATNQSLLIGADGSNNVIALGLSITNGGLAALSNYVVTTSQNSTSSLASVAFTGQLAASNVFAGGQLPLGTLATNSGVLGDGAFLTETGTKRAYSLNGGNLTNLQGANVTGTVGAATTASFVSAATLTNQLYASNVVSGGVFPMGTVAANTGADGWFLLNSNSARVWGLNAGALTNLNGVNIQTGTVNSNALDTATKALLGGGSSGLASGASVTNITIFGDQYVSNSLTVANSGIRITNSPIIFAAGWAGTNHIQGPSDKALTLTATAPVQASSSVAGNALTIRSSDATIGSSVAQSADAGSINITPGKGVVGANSTKYAYSGSVNITAGDGSGSGGGYRVIGGDVNIATAGAYPGSIYLSTPATGLYPGVWGNISMISYANNSTYYPGLITLYSGSPSGSSGYYCGGLRLLTGPFYGPIDQGILIAAGTNQAGNSSNVGGRVQMSSGDGSANSSASGTAGNGGTIFLNVGNGGSNSGNTSGTGGTGGAFGVSGGKGGNATGSGGTHTGGTGSSITITSGAGGSATGSSGTRTGGNSGDILVLVGTNGTGATANGSLGKIILGSTATNGTAVTLTNAFITFANVASSNNPPSSSTTASVFGATNSAGTAEIFTIDGAGTVKQISEHAIPDAPANLLDSSDPFPNVSMERNDYLGYVRWINRSREAAVAQLNLDIAGNSYEAWLGLQAGSNVGLLANNAYWQTNRSNWATSAMGTNWYQSMKQFVLLSKANRDVYAVETYAKYNQRTGGNLTKRSWTNDQNTVQVTYANDYTNSVTQYQAALTAYNDQVEAGNTNAVAPVQPVWAPPAVVPVPAWMSARGVN